MTQPALLDLCPLIAACILSLSLRFCVPSFFIYPLPTYLPSPHLSCDVVCCSIISSTRNWSTVGGKYTLSPLIYPLTPRILPMLLFPLPQKLKEQLEANQRGVMIDENGKEVMVHNARQEIVEKIVEREVIKEVSITRNRNRALTLTLSLALTPSCWY